ncbi:hypothetical protein HDE_02413 [Halotydeus destructor]|nr:hypothetical protein HDE_02413 [Halotydeus destructor]
MVVHLLNPPSILKNQVAIQILWQIFASWLVVVLSRRAALSNQFHQLPSGDTGFQSNRKPISSQGSSSSFNELTFNWLKNNHRDVKSQITQIAGSCKSTDQQVKAINDFLSSHLNKSESEATVAEEMKKIMQELIEQLRLEMVSSVEKRLDPVARLISDLTANAEKRFDSLSADLNNVFSNMRNLNINKDVAMAQELSNNSDKISKLESSIVNSLSHGSKQVTESLTNFDQNIANILQKLTDLEAKQENYNTVMDRLRLEKKRTDDKNKHLTKELCSLKYSHSNCEDKLQEFIDYKKEAERKIEDLQKELHCEKQMKEEQYERMQEVGFQVLEEQLRRIHEYEMIIKKQHKQSPLSVSETRLKTNFEIKKESNLSECESSFSWIDDSGFVETEEEEENLDNLVGKAVRVEAHMDWYDL